MVTSADVGHWRLQNETRLPRGFAPGPPSGSVREREKARLGPVGGRRACETVSLYPRRSRTAQNFLTGDARWYDPAMARFQQSAQTLDANDFALVPVALRLDDSVDALANPLVPVKCELDCRVAALLGAERSLKRTVHWAEGKATSDLCVFGRAEIRESPARNGRRLDGGCAPQMRRSRSYVAFLRR